MVVDCRSIGERQEAGRTVYIIDVVENGREWKARRHYSDFLALDQALGSVVGLSREPLPEKGVFGLRHRLNLGDFNEQRRQALHKYLEHLTSQIQSLSQLPALADFLEPHLAQVSLAPEAPPLGALQAQAVTERPAAGQQLLGKLPDTETRDEAQSATSSGTQPSGDVVPLTAAGFHAVLHKSGRRELEAFVRRLIESEGQRVVGEAGFRDFVLQHSAEKERQTFEGLKEDLRQAESRSWLRPRSPEPAAVATVKFAPAPRSVTPPRTVGAVRAVTPPRVTPTRTSVAQSVTVSILNVQPASSPVKLSAAPVVKPTVSATVLQPVARRSCSPAPAVVARAPAAQAASAPAAAQPGAVRSCSPSPAAVARVRVPVTVKVAAQPEVPRPLVAQPGVAQPVRQQQLRVPQFGGFRAGATPGAQRQQLAGRSVSPRVRIAFPQASW